MGGCYNSWKTTHLIARRYRPTWYWRPESWMWQISCECTWNKDLTWFALMWSFDAEPAIPPPVPCTPRVMASWQKFRKKTMVMFDTTKTHSWTEDNGIWKGTSLRSWYLAVQHSHKCGGILLYWLPTRLMMCPRMIKLAANINVGASDVVTILQVVKTKTKTWVAPCSPTFDGLTVTGMG